MDYKDFCSLIYDFYRSQGRSFAWRETTDSYRIVVSEIMLQQTQTSRVEVKYESWLKRFPNFESLASASLVEVLSEWQELGYNRRGKYLHEIAKKVVNEHGGELPQDVSVLEGFPGIGPNTARSIVTFTWNIPTIFIETNIRSVFIHCFFEDRVEVGGKVDDKEILELVEKTLDTDNPRQWYYALMDYGVHLKSTLKNPSRQSRHHRPQSRFKGSNRQVRAAIIRALTNQGNQGGNMSIESLRQVVFEDVGDDQGEKFEERFMGNLGVLEKEGFLNCTGKLVKIPVA